jgi:hypothetical protein
MSAEFDWDHHSNPLIIDISLLYLTSCSNGKKHAQLNMHTNGLSCTVKRSVAVTKSNREKLEGPPNFPGLLTYEL